MDDINVGLENMRFQRRDGERLDGAMAPPLDGGYRQALHARVASGDVLAFGEGRRDSRNVAGGGDSRPQSGSYLPYDQDYHHPSPPSAQGGAEYYPPSSSQMYYPDSPSTYYSPKEQPHAPTPTQHHSYGSAPTQHQQTQPHPPYQPYPQGAYDQHQLQPAFQPQPGHGGWGYDYSAAAAQNPYYAAATGQLGFPMGYGGMQGQPQGQGPAAGAGLHRVISSASSLRSLSSNQGDGRSLARSISNANLQANGQRRKVAKSGPPITKASVDEYRSRIKADPDPEAQFNFAKYLIEAAKKISSSASGDEKSAKKYRDALLVESLKLIKRLATQGTGLGKPAYADAQFFLANCLGNGSLGLSVDHEKAYNLYVQASKQNHSSATYRTAVCNEVGAGTRRDHSRAVLFYRKASALGDTAGMYKLGMILLHGLLGQVRNPKEAVGWLKRAAAQADEDNPHALHELGLLYEKPPSSSSGNQVVPYDPPQARELFTQAAQLNYPPSQFRLGCCYEYGSLTCPVDPRRSIAWYTRAAERGDAESELALSGWYLTGSEGVLKQSDEEAYLWARRAANKGLAKAEYAVGYYSEVGIGGKIEPEEAKRWYLRAAGESSPSLARGVSDLLSSAGQQTGHAATH